MYNPGKIEREFELTDLFEKFKVRSLEPTIEETKSIVGFFEQELLIKKGSLMHITKVTCWIVGDAENPDWLTTKFADYDKLLERIEPNEPVLFLDIVPCAIKKNIRERSPIYLLSKRKKANDKKLDWIYFIKIITRGGRMGYFILPFYELDEKIKIAFAELFTIATTTT
jgi:hypothetical protein